MERTEMEEQASGEYCSCCDQAPEHQLVDGWCEECVKFFTPSPALVRLMQPCRADWQWRAVLSMKGAQE